MRVAHYSTYLSRSAGGLFYSVSGLTKAEADQGIDILVVGGADKHFEEDRSQWADLPVKSYKLSSGSYGLSLEAVRQIANFKPDILHVHGIWTAASFYARAFSAMGVPLVVSPRGMLDPWILSRRQAVKRIHAAMLERPALGKAHIHALSQSEYDSVIQFMPRARSRTFVIPNGIDTGSDKATTGRSGVLYLGRLHSKKQVIDLARLWQASRHLNEINLTIAGWGDPSYEKELLSATEGVGNIRFVGPLYGEAKELALNSTLFFILPSLSEGLPMAVLEALQHGAIPIITDQCNLPELFASQVAIQIRADLTDTEQVVAAAVQLPRDELESLSNSGREYSLRYQWPTIARRMRGQYETILEQR